MKMPYKLGETLNVKVEKIVPNGFGLAFAENLTVFVPLSVAGDLVRVRIDQLKGKTAFAEIIEIIEPSADRIEPKCEYFGRCGGCNFQQMPYEKQLEAKVGIIRDSLTRIGKINFEGEIPIIPSPKEFDYRARVQWHVDTRKRKIGYFQRKSHNVIDVKKCPILTPELQETLTDLQKNIAWETFWAEIIKIEAASNQEDVSIFSDEIIEPTEELDFQLNGNRYLYNAQNFFQGNPFLIEELIETATGNAHGKNALDLYCGVGLFTLPLAGNFEKVTGVESSARAVDFAERSVENAKLSNVKFHRESVADFLSENKNVLENMDFMLLDPPRTGTEKGTIESIIKIQPKHISYVSCEPSTLARDLQILTANNYRIETITALDMFPQTHHVETVFKMAIS